MIRIGINGFGRIGKCILLQLIHNPLYQICALNAIDMTPEYIEDYLKYDSTHKMTAATERDFMVEIINKNEIKIGRHNIALFSDKNAENLPWKAYGCEYLFEATGANLTTKKCQLHDIKYIIMSAPAKDDTPTYIVGTNEEKYSGENIISAASCTTNCLAPFLRLLNDTFTINHCNFTTIHATTATQFTVDVMNKSIRTSRSIMNNIIPHTTGASSAIISVLPELNGKISGTSLRVPVTNCSLLDINVELDDQNVTLEQISQLLFNHPLYGTVFDVNRKNLVSCDFCTTTTPTILDMNASIEMGKGRFKLMLWYDNEWSYSAQMIRMVEVMFTYNNTVKPKYYIENLDMCDKGVVIRLDLNVPVLITKNIDGTTTKTIVDDFRIRSAIPTIKTAIAKSPKYIILTSHFGRPSKKDEVNSMQFMIHILSNLLGVNVIFLDSGISRTTLNTVRSTIGNNNNKFNLDTKPVIYLLENLRFHPEETEYDSFLGSDIIDIYQMLGDVFISDAFGCVHRKHMSVCGIKYFNKTYGYGHLIKKEIDNLNLLINNKTNGDNHKILGIIGGNKIKEKMPLIKYIRNIPNSQLFIAGGIAKQYNEKYNNNNNNQDNEQNNVFVMHDGYGNVSLDKPLIYIQSLNTNLNMYDIGPSSLDNLLIMIDQSDIIFWNGSLGVIEHEEYKRGSAIVVDYLKRSIDKRIIIGGGETASLFSSAYDCPGHIYISTGGGALLEYLQNKILYGKLIPGLDIFY